MKKHKVIVASVLSFISRLLGASILFVLTVLIGRELGVVQSGYYFLTFAILSVLAVISKVGFDVVILRFVGIAGDQNDNAQIKTLFYKATLIAFSVSVLIALSLYFFSEGISEYIFKNPKLNMVIKRSAFYIPFFVVTNLVAMVLQGLRRTIASVITLNISSGAVLIIALLLFEFQSAEEIAQCMVFSVFISMFIGLFFLRNVFRVSVRLTESVPYNVLLSSAIPLWVGAIMGLMTQWSGQLVLGTQGDFEQVALLSVAQRTSMLVTLILMSVNMAMSPTYAALYDKKDIAGLERLAHTSLKIMMLFAFPVLLVMFFFPENVLSVFGSEFKQAGSILQILAIGQFINVSTGSVGYLLSMSGHEKDFRNAVLISGVVCLILNLILVPKYNSLGAAISIAIGVGLQNIIALFLVKKRLNIKAFFV